MSWGGSGGFFGAARPAAVPAAPVRSAVAPLELDQLRGVAREAYATGNLTEATEAQTAVLTMATASGTQAADDFLFAGLIHHAARRIADATSTLRDGLLRYPHDPALHENLAVVLLAQSDVAGAIAACETAISLGSVSANVHDCLCEAYQRAGRIDLAVAAGRLALEAKDRRFGGAAPLARIPDARPPAFAPDRPEQNVIAYSLWGNQPRYQVPLLENARIRPHLFPEWSMRVYHDHSVDRGYLGQLTALGVQLWTARLPPRVPQHRALLWRFEVIADPAVARFLIRDADALLTVKERVAVDAWLQSAFYFHSMRDWYTHTDLLLAGMWGGVGGILPAPEFLLRAYTAWRVENDHVDQDLLTETVWPSIRRSVLIHDSIFHPCLGSVRFPPFGLLPAGHHIGQNAFLHFSKA